MRADEIRTAVRDKYRAVAAHPDGCFSYPIGRPGALALGYLPEWLDGIPAGVVDRFVGVGNPFRIQRPQAGERVLDVGCGCGLDAFVATSLVGPSGRVRGLDLTAEMLEPARRALAGRPGVPLEFCEGDAATLPFPDGSFDRIVSNGALNLVPDKDAMFAELRRVLRDGGLLTVADLLVVESVPDSVLASMDAWSS